MFIITILKRIFTWWNSQTFGTWLYTARKGKLVGEDAQGNKYYTSQEKDFERRWVIYNGTVEATRIAPDWHAWLHRITDEPPSETPLPVKSWEKQHIPNLTGLNDGYAPRASLLRKGEAERANVTGDYEAWSPDQ
ncbi:MAG: NADH:ubiquinone oxidoreductase subunit NDUFA12 [Pseudomonadota bacterium]